MHQNALDVRVFQKFKALLAKWLKLRNWQVSKDLPSWYKVLEAFMKKSKSGCHYHLRTRLVDTCHIRRQLSHHAAGKNSICNICFNIKSYYNFIIKVSYKIESL